MPDAKELALIAALIAQVTTYLGFTAPAAQQRDKNQDGILFLHKRSEECNRERIEWQERYLELVE